MGGRKSSHPDLMAFNTWADVQEYANADEGRDLKVMVKLLDSYGVEAILGVCETSCNEASADLIVSTAHKAKGREWGAVRLADDFRAPEEGNLPAKSELMLLYVGITRAKITLDCTAVAWVDALGAA
jgi:superfamily I DNA/RNA helicase